MEMGAESYVIAMTSPADTEEGMERLVSALTEIDGKLAKKVKDERNDAYLPGRAGQRRGEPAPVNEQIYTPAQAEALENAEYIPLSECEGRVVLEYAYIYPPGIPLTVPGEKVSAETAEHLKQYEAAGFCVEGTELRGKVRALVNG